jgi:hypothetical protein
MDAETQEGNLWTADASMALKPFPKMHQPDSLVLALSKEFLAAKRMGLPPPETPSRSERGHGRLQFCPDSVRGHSWEAKQARVKCSEDKGEQ